jgi:ribonuclease III
MGESGNMESDIKELERKLDYRFNDRVRVLQALTHPSFEHERAGDGNYQRLEFLGDAVLGMALAEALYGRFPESNEGVLSRFRSQVADQDTLAGIARSLDLGRFVRLGRGEEQGAGRDKDSILADVLEALIAAVYLDGGLDEVRRLIRRLFDPILDNREATLKINDAKSELQELLCARRRPSPLYRLIDESGPPHDRLFRFQVLVDGVVVGEGEGRSKKVAQQAAAAQALETYSHTPEAP